jgi:HNH endonuclease
MSINSRPALAGLSDKLRLRIPARLQANSRKDKETGCLIWKGCRGGQGYGVIVIGGKSGRHVGAHRVAWEIVNGPIPHGLLVRHRCHNRLCINPAHLQLGTHQENMSDMTGALRGHTRLTDHQVVEIQGLSRFLGYKRLEIAALYGLPRRTVDAILNNTRRQNAIDIEFETEQAKGRNGAEEQSATQHLTHGPTC